jgi:hypothetical protein
VNASLSSLNAAGDDGFLHTFCNGASNKECSANASTRGFSNYTSLPGEMIEFYLHCAGPVQRNITLSVSAKYLYTIVDDVSEGLSGGGIAGIVIACIIVFIVAVAIIFF